MISGPQYIIFSTRTYIPELNEVLQVRQSHVQAVDLRVEQEQYKKLIVTKADTVVNPVTNSNEQSTNSQLTVNKQLTNSQLTVNKKFTNSQLATNKTQPNLKKNYAH